MMTLRNAILTVLAVFALVAGAYILATADPIARAMRTDAHAIDSLFAGQQSAHGAPRLSPTTAQALRGYAIDPAGWPSVGDDVCDAHGTCRVVYRGRVLCTERGARCVWSDTRHAAS